jgi:hypothetical protein
MTSGTRVVKDYTDRGLAAPYNPAQKDQSRWTFEPHVAMRVTLQMLDEAGVTVLTERYLESVTKVGPRITSLVTKNGTFTARVFVDGTYEGDLMAAAGVDWTIGREGPAEYGESLAGKQYPKQEMNINGFDDEGNLLPLVTTDDAGDEEAGDKNVMTYSFRLCLTEDPNNRVPMPAAGQLRPGPVRSRSPRARRPARASGSTSTHCPAVNSTATTPSAGSSRWAWSAVETNGTRPMKPDEADLGSPQAVHARVFSFPDDRPGRARRDPQRVYPTRSVQR